MYNCFYSVFGIRWVLCRGTNLHSVGHACREWLVVPMLQSFRLVAVFLFEWLVSWIWFLSVRWTMWGLRVHVCRRRRRPFSSVIV